MGTKKRAVSKRKSVAGLKTARAIQKCPTGIRGLDEITVGGLPRGRTTLICGNAGCGKTMVGMEFLVRGATLYDEPGVCVSFEETVDEIASNLNSLGFDIRELIDQKKLIVDFVYIEPSEIEETGDYDLEALFVRLAHAVDSIGAKRVLLDSVEALFGGLANETTLRSELRRLFRWLKERGLTAVVTGERGPDGMMTRHGIEEYISDCVILLDNRVNEAISTRRLRVVKYRGSMHGTNEYPFLIDSDGVSVLPVTSLELNHAASGEHVSMGVPELDAMLGGKGVYRGSSILVTGTAGSGKTSLLSHFVNAACGRGERCVYFSFEESPEEIVRNMKSIGIDLQKWIQKGLLLLHSSRPTSLGLEMHLIRLHKIVAEFAPDNVVIDPVTALLNSGTQMETEGMLVRMIDFFKEKRMTALMTSLTNNPNAAEQSEVDISSMIDTWILLRNIESGSERNRGLFILKARGISHSNQVREFLITNHGVELRQVYRGNAGLVTGSNRIAQEARDASETMLSRQKIEKWTSSLNRTRKRLESDISALRLQLESEEQETSQVIEQERLRLAEMERGRSDLERSGSLHIRAEPDAARKGKK